MYIYFKYLKFILEYIRKFDGINSKILSLNLTDILISFVMWVETIIYNNESKIFFTNIWKETSFIVMSINNAINNNSLKILCDDCFVIIWMNIRGEHRIIVSTRKSLTLQSLSEKNKQLVENDPSFRYYRVNFIDIIINHYVLWHDEEYRLLK